MVRCNARVAAVLIVIAYSITTLYHYTAQLHLSSPHFLPLSFLSSRASFKVTSGLACLHSIDIECTPSSQRVASSTLTPLHCAYCSAPTAVTLYSHCPIKSGKRATTTIDSNSASHPPWSSTLSPLSQQQQHSSPHHAPLWSKHTLTKVSGSTSLMLNEQ